VTLEVLAEVKCRVLTMQRVESRENRLEAEASG
jgi:hypothetical protein